MTNEASGPAPGLATPVEPVSVEPALVDYEDEHERMPRRRTRALAGIVALAASALGLLALVAGVSVAASRTADADDWAFASVLALAANVLTAAGFLGGLAAVILRRGRPWGVAAMVLGVVANPFMLLSVFSLLG